MDEAAPPTLLDLQRDCARLKLVTIVLSESTAAVVDCQAVCFKCSPSASFDIRLAGRLVTPAMKPETVPTERSKTATKYTYCK